MNERLKHETWNHKAPRRRHRKNLLDIGLSAMTFWIKEQKNRQQKQKLNKEITSN